jgi:hypothetical protein
MMSERFKGEQGDTLTVSEWIVHTPDLGLEGIVSKRAASRYRSGPSKSWLKIKNMVESEFILLGTEPDSDGVPWALLASERDGQLEFAGPAILNPPTRSERPGGSGWGPWRSPSRRCEG